MRLTRTRVIAAGILAATVTGVAFVARPRPLDVDSARVTRGPMEATIDADGRTQVRERYVVTAPVSGRVRRIALDEGDSVRAGQPVAWLEPVPLDVQAAAQARSRVDAALAVAREAETRVRLSRESLAQRRRDLERAERLGDAGGIAPRDVEAARLAVREAEEDVRAANERRSATLADVRQARAALGMHGGLGDGLVVVRAPAAGRVLRVPEPSERVVPAGTPLLEVGDPRRLEVVVDVLSSDGASIRAGAPVRLEQWGGDSALAGRVREVEPAAFTKLSALGVEEQRVNVLIDVPGAPAALGDGYRVEARIVTWSADDVLRVPTSALMRDGAEWSVYVIADGRARRRAVRIGHLGDATAEVRDGLGAEDEVILFPSDQISGGIRVASREE